MRPCFGHPGGTRRWNTNGSKPHRAHVAITPRCPRQQSCEIIRQIAWKDGDGLEPIEHLCAQSLALERRADDAWQFLAVTGDFGLTRGPQRGKRQRLDFGAAELGTHTGAARQLTEQRLEPVVRRMMQVVGLGGRKQDTIDAPGHQSR